ncbi:hypothetical protein [Pedobacter sp.]|uniref:hypothetical protein n=1 Tax=Pedobacter sp. TaxID=1411316 RepID=UPI003D7FB5BB
MGIGVSAMVSLLDDQDVRYALLANYRLYFGNKKANGFFIEGNMGVVAEEHELKKSTKAYFGLGAATGAKFLTRNGLLGEAYLGAGRLLGNSSSGYYPRVGVTIGKRF